MGQLLTANVATNLYWLGRYLERIEGTLYEIDKAYDKIIDVDKNAGIVLYKKFDIDLEYSGALDFLSKAILGDHDANLANLMRNARENSIISRANIEESAFGEIIQLHELFQNIVKCPRPVDYRDIDSALSLISEIWGAHTKMGHRRFSDHFLKLGKLVEEVDFRIRFNRGEEMTKFLLQNIDRLIKIIGPDLKIDKLKKEYDDKSIDIMDSIYKKIDKLIVY